MKRIISLVLSLVIILSMVCVAAPSVSAASAMKTSDPCITLIKTFEGFAKYPYPDNGNWTVGYGTNVTGADLEKYQENGITPEEADKLMRTHLAGIEKSLNDFIDKHGLKLSQNKFDALICFTYNLGYGWMKNTSYTFTQAVINGATGNDFIFAITQWCKVSGAVNGGLINRRLSEANLYLNGVYSNTAPINFRYVIFGVNAEGAVTDLAVQGYDSTTNVSIKAVATREGHQFLGWYTKAVGGAEVTKLNAKTAVNKVYAHWQKNGGEFNAEGKLIGVPAEYSCYAATVESRKIYDIPGGEVVKNVEGTDKLNVVAEHIDSDGIKWGNLKNGGWFKISAGIDSAPVVEKPESVIDPITVTVTASGVSNRVGPGTNYAKQGTFTKGQKLILTAVQKGGSYLWGKSEEGWICLNYTDYETVVVMNSPEATKVTAIGTVIKTAILNVRAGVGAHTAKVGTYKRGDTVKITLRQKVGSTTWGLTEKGWISLYYVKLTEVKDGEVPDIDFGGGSDDATTPDDSGSGNGNTTVIQTGKIVNCKTLRIRAGAGTNYPTVGEYAKNTYVNIYETVPVGVDVWGRTDKGWISLRYVQLDAPTTGQGITGRIVNCSSVNVRAGAGTNFAKVAKLAKGTKVEILEYTKVGNAIWGRTYQGWIHLYYVRLDAPLTDLDKKNEPSTEPDTGSGEGTGTGTGSGEGTGTGTGSGEGTGTGTGSGEGTGTGTGSGEGTGTGTGSGEGTGTGTGSGEGTDTGTGTGSGEGTGEGTGSGEGEATPDVDTEIVITFGGTIKGADSIKIRAAAGQHNPEVGTYKKGDRVTILETTSVGNATWGRTDKGWISLYYVQLDGTTNVEGVVVRTIKVGSTLTIRSKPSTSGKVVGSYKNGTVVIIYEQVTEAKTKMVWGRTNKGWISMTYAK